MANKKDNPRPIFKQKSAAEKLLESPLSPTTNTEKPENESTKRKELKRTTSYYRPEQVKFMRRYCESLRNKFNNESIKPPLLQRVLLEIWDNDTARKVEEYLKQHGYDKGEE